MSNTCSFLSQIYLEQWEKNNNVEKEVKESKDQGNVYSDLQVKTLTEDKPVLTSSSAPLTKIKIEQNEKKKSQWEEGHGSKSQWAYC